jgi:hypothetical protein
MSISKILSRTDSADLTYWKRAALASDAEAHALAEATNELIAATGYAMEQAVKVIRGVPVRDLDEAIEHQKSATRKAAALCVQIQQSET